MMCAYCQEARAVNRDHVIPRHIIRVYNRHAPLEAPSIPAEWLETVPSCFACNIRKGHRRLVPPSWEKRLSRLNKFFGGVPWRVWHGDPKEDVFRLAWTPDLAKAVEEERASQ